jgi:hypothetical protein
MLIFNTMHDILQDGPGVHLSKFKILFLNPQLINRTLYFQEIVEDNRCENLSGFCCGGMNRDACLPARQAS